MSNCNPILKTSTITKSITDANCVQKATCYEVSCVDMQVQILVHVRPADSRAQQHFELVPCECVTTIRELKEQVS